MRRGETSTSQDKKKGKKFVGEPRRGGSTVLSGTFKRRGEEEKKPRAGGNLQSPVEDLIPGKIFQRRRGEKGRNTENHQRENHN